MKKIIVLILTAMFLMTLYSCKEKADSIGKVPEGFSEKYLIGNYSSGGGGFEDYDFWESLPAEYRICYDGTVEFYMPTLDGTEISGLELAGSYKLTEEEMRSLLEVINLKKLYKLDPKENWGVCDGSSKTLDVYDENGEILKKCGGYMPDNKDFLEMYNAVRNTLHLEEHYKFRQAWIEKLKQGE